MSRRSIAFLKSGIQNRGGLEKYTLRLADAFASHGHKAVILTTDYASESCAKQKYEIVNLGTRCKLSLLHLLRFDSACRKYIDEHEFDFVFGMDRNFCPQTHYRAGNGVHAAYLDRRKLHSGFLKSLSFSLNPLHHMILQMEKSTFESAHLQTLFTNSHMVKEEVLRYYNVKPEKICVVHNGVEWNELEKPFEEGLRMRQVLQRQLGLRPDRFQFLFIGNDYQRKGLDLLLQALSRFEKKNFELSVCGKERHPELYEKKARELGLQDHVRFFGAVKEIKTFYSVADALVIPSMYDPFANVTVEALAMGVYVISSSANGGSEVITSDNEGLVFSDLQDPDELTSCLEKAMMRPKTDARALQIRQKVAHLDYSIQLNKIVNRVVTSPLFC